MRAPSKLPVAMILTWLAAGLGGTACSLKDPGSKTVRISLTSIPTVGPALSAGTGATRATYRGSARFSGAPGSAAEFTCFGINVIGAGIPPSAALSCRKGTALGALGGLVPISPNAGIDLELSSGQARTVQLFALRSTAGCPAFSELIADIEIRKSLQAAGIPVGTGAFDGIDQPYLVGQATVDVLTDTEVRILASYDPLNPVRMFEGCSESTQGSDSTPAAGFLGAVNVSPIPAPVPTTAVLGNSSAPGAAIGAPELTALSNTGPAVAIPPAALVELDSSFDSSNLLATTAQVATAYGSGGNGKRAVIQLQWDLSGLDLTQSTYSSLKLMIRGGAEGASCPASPLSGPDTRNVTAGVYDGLHGYWLASAAQSTLNGITQWGSSGFALLPLSLDKLAVTKSDGRKYLIVNVESNFVSNSPGCASVVRVGQAVLHASPIAPPINPSPALTLGSDLLTAPGNGSSPVFIVPQGGSGAVYASGGTEPYTFYVLSGSSAAIDPVTGHLTSGAKGDVTVGVSDASGLSANAQVRVVAADDVVALSISGGPSLGATPAGGCYPYVISALNYLGTPIVPLAPVSAVLSVDNLTGGITSAGGEIHSSFDTSCSSAQISPSVSISGTTSVSVNVKFNLAGGMSSFNVAATDAGILPDQQQVAVSLGTPNRYKFSGPAQIYQGVCTAYTMSITDEGGNPLPAAGNYSLPVTGMGGGTIDFAAGCPSPATTGNITIATGQTTATFYLTATVSGTPQNLNLITNTIVGTPSVFMLGNSLNVGAFPPGAPTAFQIEPLLGGIGTASTATCYVLTLDTIGPDGNPAASGANNFFHFQASGAGTTDFYGSLADCTGGTNGLVSMITYPAASSSATYYFKTSAAGTLNIQVWQSASIPLSGDSAFVQVQ